jgi:hypothetical protein
MDTLRKFLSRKFLVFLVATIGLFTTHLPPEHWVALAAFYAGIEGFLDWRSLITARSTNESTPREPGTGPEGDAGL